MQLQTLIGLTRVSVSIWPKAAGVMRHFLQANMKSPQLMYSFMRPYSGGDLKIYTRTGDKGTTNLYSGERQRKDGPFFKALGTTDELSSHIGLAKEYAAEKKHEYADQLERIQCILQDISSLLATPRPQYATDDPERETRIRERLSFNPRHIIELEEWIDKYSSVLPPLTNFILPGGGRVSASLHVARTVCRRAERTIVPLIFEGLIDEQIIIYINRLSDYLFTVARYASFLDGNKETIYIRPQPHKSRKDDRRISENQEIIRNDG
ncbi:corrinoid adenosyltransferase MMAB [Procambarus clarkii]|uniref:corrinoid adenosyltransferase MMAB n=1 Tax=Procambarus clarkii TaxID=6728 RepID=UPI001E672E32|nr:corrinoid adenosyltransferase-like [Procambarus clarkii]XP_045609972.1 corrinoid adenosyltransferase-like [Procambarus clarkii]